MYRKYRGFLHVFHFQFSNQTNQKQWYLQCFDKTPCKKNRCFGTIFRIFSARARQVKNKSFFAAFLPPLIRTQEGVKSPKIAKLHLNSTFCLSQSLPQSSNTNNCLGPQNAVNYGVLWTYHAFYLQKKGTPPPQLKLTVLVPPERHALLHLRCGRISRTGDRGKTSNPGDGAIVVLPYHTSRRGWYSCYSEGLDSWCDIWSCKHLKYVANTYKDMQRPHMETPF